MLCFLVATGTGCEEKVVPPSGPLTPRPTTSPQPQPQPQPRVEDKADLRIAKIETFPRRPRAGERFTVNVYVRNAGMTSSGAYDLLMRVRDVAHGGTYPIGTFRKTGLRSGEQVVAFTKNDLLVNSGGSHQLVVEIRPFDFADGDPSNNAGLLAFHVIE